MASLMSLIDVDLFNLFRWLLAIVCTVYAVIQTINSAIGWYHFLSPRHRYTGLMRQYLLLHLARLGPRPFAGELAKIAILSAACLGVIWLHRFV